MGPRVNFMTQEKIGRGIIVATLLALVLVYVARFPNHFSDPNWPTHAKTHLLVQIVTGSAFVLVAIFLATRLLSTTRRHFWFALMAFWFIQFGSYWGGKVWFETDVAWRGGNTIFVLMTIAYLIGLVMTGHYCMTDNGGDN